ncbi:MAG: lysogenization protein HflD [Arenicellales bacterium]
MALLSRVENRVLALAGIAQCSKLVQDIARRGRASEDAKRETLARIIVFDESDPEIALGGIESNALGLADLMVKRADPFLMERVRTITAIVNLERFLCKQPQVIRALRSRLETFAEWLGSSDIDSPTSVDELAAIYTETLSHLGPRIMIKGEQSYLEDQRNVNEIRALLLAGVRCAYVFSELGGKKWHLFLNRKSTASIAGQLYPYPRSL